MLQQNIKSKPIIPTKPANIPKPNFLIVSGGNGDGSSVHSKPLPSKNQHNEIPPNNVPMGGAKKKDFSHFTIPSSPNIGDCANDCCGIAILNNAILNNKHLEQQLRSNDNHHANSMHSNGHGINEENGNSNGNSNEMQNNKNMLKTPTDSFDSSSLSSSSGGFKDVEFLTKTKVAYDLYDKEDNIMQLNNHNNKSNENLSQDAQPSPPPPPVQHQPLPIVASQSKVLEIQSKLIAQQQQQQNKLQNSTTNSTTPVNIHNSSQYQKSSKDLEKVLVFRIDKENCQKQSQERNIKRLSKGFDDVPENNVAALTQQISANISKQIQQKLQEEMKQQCQMIKDKFLIEKIPVQQHYNDYVVTPIFIHIFPFILMIDKVFVSLSLIVLCLFFFSRIIEINQLLA